jgi:hypothetical protein
MEKSKGVRSNERGNERDLCKLEGKVVFSETVPTGYGSCLKLKLDFTSEIMFEEVRWQNLIRNGCIACVKSKDRIRGFYHQSDGKRIVYLDAYELLDDEGNVLTRTHQLGYGFTEK